MVLWGQIWLQLTGRALFMLIDPLDTAALGPTRAQAHRAALGSAPNGPTTEDRFAMLDVWRLFDDQSPSFPRAEGPLRALDGRSRTVPLTLPGEGGVLPVRVVELLPGAVT